VHRHNPSHLGCHQRRWRAGRTLSLTHLSNDAIPAQQASRARGHGVNAPESAVVVDLRARGTMAPGRVEQGGGGYGQAMLDSTCC